LTGVASPLVPPLFQDKNIGSTLTDIVFASFALAFTLIALVAGKVVDSVGHKKVIIFAAILMFFTTVSYGLVCKIESQTWLVSVAIVLNISQGKRKTNSVF
jgi:MFS family permease